MDRIVSLFTPVRRYRCWSYTCKWKGNLSSQGIHPALIPERPRSPQLDEEAHFWMCVIPEVPTGRDIVDLRKGELRLHKRVQPEVARQQTTRLNDSCQLISRRTPS